MSSSQCSDGALGGACDGSVQLAELGARTPMAVAWGRWFTLEVYSDSASSNVMLGTIPPPLFNLNQTQVQRAG